MLVRALVHGLFDRAHETRAEATGEGIGTTMRHVLRVSVVFLALLSHSPLAVAQQPTADQPGISRNEASTTLAQADAVNDTGVATARAVAVGLRELSPWSMFLSASLVAQAIMVGLAFASLVTWTTFIGKFIELSISKRRLVSALNAVSKGRALKEAVSAGFF